MSIKSKIVNLIAVRMKSSRLPKKALLLLEGRPVLWHLVDRVSRANAPEKTIICTSTLPEDEPIVEFARRYKFLVFRGHPENVFLRFIKAAQEYQAEHIVRITGDNPLTDPFLIDEMTNLHIQEKADYTYTEDTPRGTRPEIISLNALKKCLKLAENPYYSEYMTLYFKDYPQVFKLCRYSCPSPKYNRPDYIVTIDTPLDFKIVSEIYRNLYSKDKRFTLLELIEFLDSHPEIEHLPRKKVSHVEPKINTKLNISNL